MSNESTTPVRFILEDPRPLTGQGERELLLQGRKGESLLALALRNGIGIEHTCGGVCACATCHVYVKQGMSSLTEASEKEMDEVEVAPGLRPESRLACQCVITGDGPIVVEVPAWNRNAAREG